MNNYTPVTKFEFEPISILDHGYMEFVEHWGCDERVVEAARMSTGKGFVSWEPYKDHPRGDLGLLDYLHRNRHGTPFEMAGMTLVLQAPIMVFREWHRHRTQCAKSSTLIHFDAPKSQENRRYVQKQTIAELHRKWQPTRRVTRQERQKDSCWSRTRIHRMQLRMLHESQLEIGHTRITNVIQGNPKEMFEVTVESGKQITTSLDHRYFTDKGWLTLEQAIDLGVRLCVETVFSGQPKSWPVEHDFSKEIWKKHPLYKIEVSSEGRIRTGLFVSFGTESPNGYPVVYTPYGTKFVHCLVLEAFVGSSDLPEVRHLNNNRADCRLVNLAYGTSKENAADRILSDRQQRLRSTFERITRVRPVGMEDSYDLEVMGPFHNFVANGFVIHNSYNEMSARYIPLPDVNYIPSVDRCMVAVKGTNRQAAAVGVEELTHERVLDWLESLDNSYKVAQASYELGLKFGIPKELARLPVPVGRYSRMMASANLRNWLAFLTLRMDSHAQWEIRQFANQVGRYIKTIFPHVWSVYVEGKPFDEILNMKS